VGDQGPLMARGRSSLGFWLVVLAVVCATIVIGAMFLERQMIYLSLIHI
jgi:hypothetical protein